MAKKVNWVSNIRVDLDDLEQGTHGYSGELSNELVDCLVKDNYPRVSEGFRVELADTTNRVITVYSGVAVDQSGKVVNNSESTTTSRSITLTGDATYYIEVEFVDTLGTTDSRAFWDTTFDNGLDTSGDILPDGREFAQNIATRKTGDWQIVSPPSTTGFQVTSSAPSTRIPVAVVTVLGGVITTPSSTSEARTTFARTHSAGVTTIRGLNTRIFPDAFTARLGPGTANQEDVAVTANARSNGVLTLGAGTANSHDIGERIVVQGGTQTFIGESVAMDASTGVDGGGPIPNVDGDGRIRMFQGDTEAGYTLSQDPSQDTGESDIQVKNLKEQVDYLASQMLEMKYGAGSRDLLGTVTPPNDFTTTAHYSRSGGIINARAHTVSVGDGVASWGDYNTTTSGSAQAALQAAYDALPVNGGIIYVKAGTYTIVNTAVAFVDKPVWLIGESRDATVITATGTASAIDFDTATITQEFSNMFRMDNISVTYSGGFSGTHAMTCTSAARMLVNNCRIYGIDATGTQIDRSVFNHCRFRQSTSGTGSTLEGRWNECTFNRCYIDMDAAVAAQRAVLLGASSSKLVFNECTFQVSSTAVAQVEFAADTTDVVFRNCEFAADVGPQAFVQTAAGTSNITAQGCKFLCTGGVGNFNNADTIRIIGCEIAVPQNASALIFENDSRDVVVDDCKFTQATTTALETGVGLDLGGVSGARISGCHFIDCDYGMFIWEVSEGGSTPHGTVITGCQFTRVTSGRCRRGVSTGTNATTAAATSTISRLYFDSCMFFGFSDASANEIYGIFLEATITTPAGGVSIHGCEISTIGDVGGGNNDVVGVALATSGVTSSSVFFGINISDCSIGGVNGSSTNYGILLENVSRATVTNNQISSIGSNSTALSCSGIRGLLCNDIVASNNLVRLVGSSGKNVTGAGIHIGTTGQTAQNERMAISSNVIKDLNSSSNGIHGIYLEESAQHTAISGNTISGGTRIGNGVYLGPEVNADTVNLANSAITGNSVNNVTTGIFAVMDDTNDFDEGVLSITGNVIDDFDGTGVYVEGADLNTSACIGLTISGNTLRTNATGILYGIRLLYMNSASVSSNSIHLGTTAAAQQRGIYVTSSDNMAISSNLVVILATGVCHGVSLTGCINTTICANMVNVEGDSSANSFGIFDDAGTGTNFANANHVDGLPAPGVSISGITTTGDNKIL